MGNIVEKVAFHPPYPPAPLPKNRTKWLGNAQGDQIPIVYYHHPETSHVVVYSHGNATDLGQMSEFYKHLAKKIGASVLGYEYLGYGHATAGDEDQISCSQYLGSSVSSTSGIGNGSQSPYPSEKGCLRALRTVYTYLTEERKIPPRKIILMGQSIGTGPTVAAAATLPVGGVILISPFKSATRVVTESSFARPFDIFNNQEKIRDIEAPVLIMHGTMDSVIPVDHGQYLYQLIKGTTSDYPPVWITGADHNNMEQYADYYKALKKFIEDLFFQQN